MPLPPSTPPPAPPAQQPPLAAVPAPPPTSTTGMDTKAHTTTTTTAASRERLTHRLTGLIRRNPIKSVAFAAAVASMVASKHKREQQVEELAKKKKVLVLPFYKMKIVEETKRDLRSLLRKSSSEGGGGGGGNGDPSIEMAVDELVNLIHEAARDPNVVALYGIFGQGHGFQTGGWAHIQEIRNALLVFQQSHRVHKEPVTVGKYYNKKGGDDADDDNDEAQKNLSDDNKHQGNVGNNSSTSSGSKTNNGSGGSNNLSTNRKKKVLYAYANTFASPLPGSDGMKEYYLASVFTHIHLQPQGDLNLFGMHTTNTFFRDFLKKYGIQVDVFKHGLYKNFANQFTHSKYTKEHRENVEGILKSIHEQICDSIYIARNNTLKNFEPTNFWDMVHQAGSFPAEIAHKIGFVDYMPRKDPLQALLTGNDKKETKEHKDALKKGWSTETDFDQFGAETNISISTYARLVKQREAKGKNQWMIYKQFKEMAEKYNGIDKLFGALGYAAPYYNIPKSDFSDSKAKAVDEKIAVIKIGGTIGEGTARKMERALRKLKNNKDVKAVVLRVDSPGGAVTACETIYQEIADLPQKVVVSFGNVSASGGYYISANADRIFASPMTITGSIGVIMVRLDLRGLAQQYGITFDSVTTSGMSGSFDPFCPINHQMKDNFANYTDRAYMNFKTLVSNGRALDMDMVETIAQGRVWTGEQAKRIGLVDELGGLDRAIAYCQRNYTTSGQASVVAWPPKKSFMDLLSKQGNHDEEDLADFEVPSALHFIVAPIKDLLGSADRVTPMESWVFGKRMPRITSATSGMMLTINENWAIRCLLQENEFTDILADLPPGFFD